MTRGKHEKQERESGRWSDTCKQELISKRLKMRNTKKTAQLRTETQAKEEQSDKSYTTAT